MQNEYKTTATDNPDKLRQYTTKGTHFYNADFLEFCKTYLPGEVDFWINDIDTFILRNRTGEIMLLEIKKNGYRPKPNQVRGFKIIDALMRAGQDATGGRVTISVDSKPERYRVNYRGFFLLTLSGTNIKESKLYWGAKEVTMDELADLLSFNF